MDGTLTFEEAKLALRKIGRRYEADQISIGAWCNGVHDVLARFQAGRNEAPMDVPPLAATAAPRVTDCAETIAPEFGNVVASAYRPERHLMTGHPA